MLFINLDWELINKKLDSLNLNDKQKEEMRQNFLHIQAEQMRQGRKKMNIREFEPLTIIGRGAFGEVRVCRQISTGDIVAIKKMRKNNFLGQRKELTLEEMIKLGKITTKTFDRVSIVKSYIEKKYSLKTQKTDEKNKGKNIKC